jgi:hypothetical protein
MEIWMEGVGWIYLAVVRVIWLAIVSVVMKRGHLNRQLLLQKSAVSSYVTRP